jgi:sec-independent protein translocase protein TatB
MFDIGWPELFLIMAVSVLVIGPKEIPAIMRTLGRIVRRLQYVKYAFSQQFEDFLRENDMDDLRKSVNFEEKDFDEAAADEDLELPQQDDDEPRANKQSRA